MAATRRHFVAGVALAATGAAFESLAGSKNAFAITPGRPYAGQQVKVLAVTSTQFAAHAKRAAAFEAETGIKVSYAYAPFTAMREKLTAEMVGGSADFDLVTAMDVWIPPMVDTYLAPIGKPMAARGVDLSDYPAAFLQVGQFKDELYGLPSRCHIQLLYYRKDLFAEVGLQPPKTWDEVIAAGQAIQAKHPEMAGIAVSYGRGNGHNLMVWYNFLWAAGGDLFDARMRPVFNSPAGLKATQDYVDLMLKYHITPTGAASFIEQDAVGSFVQGRSAMIPIWWHVYNRFSGKDSAIRLDQVGFVPLPTYGSVAPTTYVNAWIYGINKASKVPDAAAEYLAWISRPAIERDILLDPAENDVVAVHWSNLRDPAVNARFGGMHAIAAKALENTKRVPNIPEFLPVVDVLEVAMSNIATGQAKVADAMNGAASQVARIMRRAG